jgi:hypothetical protein
MGLTSVKAVLSFTNGGLTDAFTQALAMDVVTTRNTSSITSSVNSTRLPVICPATGAFKGSITLVGPPTRPASFFGQIVKIGSITQDYGYFLIP